MPSDRKQVNVRVDADTEDLMERLIPAVSAAIGLPISQSDLFRLGLLELERKYLAGSPVAPPPPAKKPRGKSKG